MVNLPRDVKQKTSRGQSAIDYVFMFAVGLLLVLIALEFIIGDYGPSRDKAMEYAENSSIKSQAVMSKSHLENSGFWNENYTVFLNTNYKIDIYSEEVLVYTVNYENATYKEDVTSEGSINGLSFGEIYERCLNNDLNACKFVIILRQGTWEEK